MNYDKIYNGYLAYNYFDGWHWFERFDDAKDNEEVYGLTEEGDDLFSEWSRDASVGYNLYDGRAYGLADRYTHEEIVGRIINDDELSVKIEDYE